MAAKLRAIPVFEAAKHEGLNKSSVLRALLLHPSYISKRACESFLKVEGKKV